MQAGPARRGDSGVVKRSLSIAGHRTSVSLEEPFWTVLRSLAAARATSVQTLVAQIDQGRGSRNLSSAIRIFVLEEVMRAQPPG